MITLHKTEIAHRNNSQKFLRPPQKISQITFSGEPMSY